MLKMLRYDFYKIFKSKALLGVFGASVCLSICDALKLWLVRNEVTGVFVVLNANVIVSLLPFIFVPSFVCKDYSSKFTKNFFPEYSFKDKICYVLSKVVYIFAACVIWYAVYFATYCALIYLRCHIQQVPFVFENISYDGTVLVSVPEGTLSFFCVFANAFAIGMFVLFLSLLIKKDYIIIVVTILYWYALSYIIYDALNKALGLEDIFYTVEWFTLFGMLTRLGDGFYIPDGREIVIAGYKQSLLVCLGYALLFIFLSCVVVAVKRPSKMKQAVKEGSAVC